MKHEIIWSKDAGDELTEIISYIKYNTGKTTAEKIYTKIINKVKQVSENPEGRRIAPLLREFGINYIHQVNNHRQRRWLECWPLKGALKPCYSFPVTVFSFFMF